MGSDRARVTYDPKQQYRSVVMQQGRVTLEADWNEAQQITLEEIRREALDFVGPCGTPDDGYKVVLASEPTNPPFDFTVSAGTMYVGGMRAHLIDSVQYSNQPDWHDKGPEDPDWVDLSTLPNSPPVDEFVYLSLREQEVSAVEDPELKDVALGGPDTAQRTRLLQRIVRVACNGTDCGTGLSAAETHWQSEGLYFDPDDMRLRSWSTLEVGFSDQAQAPNPCQPQAQGGYLGPDNQLIRVQISGIDQASGNPKFLWGLDDASFLYRIEVDAGNSAQLDLQTIPVDAYHQPASGQAVELLQTAADLPNGGNVAATSGYVITLARNYDPDTQSIQIPSGYSLPADYLAANQSPPSQLFLRVWQQEVVFVPGQPATLGNTGLTVTLQTTGGQPFHLGDYWLFAVRPATPQTVYPERYQNGFQPPDGPRLWACPLGVIAWSGEIGTLIKDCRNQCCNLVNLCKQKQQGCCTFVVSPQDLVGNVTLQNIVDQAASPTMFVQAVTAGKSGNNIAVRISNVHGNPSPPVFDLTVTEVDIYDGLTSANIEGIIGDEEGGPNTGLAHMLVGSVNTQLTPANNQFVTFTGGDAGTAQGDVIDSNQNLVFTLQVRNPGTDGNVTRAAISNLNGSMFTLTVTWTRTVIGVSMATLFSTVQNSMSYLITAQPPQAVSPVLPAEGTTQLNGGVNPDPNTGADAIPARAGVFGIPATVCLRPGVYYLPAPLVLLPDHSNVVIESCAGTPTLAAARGAEGAFLQGLVVLNSADNVTLCGLRLFLPPPVRLIPGGIFLTDINLTDLEAILARDSRVNIEQVAFLLAQFYVSIGVRPVACNGLSIRNCSFYFQNETGVVREAALLEAAVLANGGNSTLSLENNRFIGQVHLTPVSNPLLEVRVGYLLTPSVDITGVSPIIRFRAGEAAGAPVLLRHEKGTLLPALLDGASFNGNVFQGLEIPLLIFSECGAVAFEDNTVTDCYSGPWIIARRSLPEPSKLSWEPPLDIYQDPMLETALAIAGCFPLPAGGTSATIRVPSAALPSGTPPFQTDFLNLMNALMRIEFSLIEQGAARISTTELNFTFSGSNNKIATYQPGDGEDSTGAGLLIWGEDNGTSTEIIVNANRIENCSDWAVPAALIVQVGFCAFNGNMILNDFKSTAAGTLFLVSLTQAIAVTGNIFNPPGNTNLPTQWLAPNYGS
jgi:hypothetical protein